MSPRATPEYFEAPLGELLNAPARRSVQEIYVEALPSHHERLPTVGQRVMIFDAVRSLKVPARVCKVVDGEGFAYVADARRIEESPPAKLNRPPVVNWYGVVALVGVLVLTVALIIYGSQWLTVWQPLTIGDTEKAMGVVGTTNPTLITLLGVAGLLTTLSPLLALKLLTTHWSWNGNPTIGFTTLALTVALTWFTAPWLLAFTETYLLPTTLTTIPHIGGFIAQNTGNLLAGAWCVTILTAGLHGVKTAPNKR